MPSYNEVDILIIGGGPAGLAAGIVFARNGLRTILIEKKRFPVDKACGEGLMPVGVQSLYELGAQSFLSKADFQPFKGVQYQIEGGQSASGLFSNGEGWGIRRTILSQALLNSALKHPALEIVEGEQATLHHLTENQLEIAVGKTVYKPRLVVGADGRSSSVRKWAGITGKPQSPYRWGAVQHFPTAPWSEMVEVHWGKDVEAYITPVGPEEISLAFLWDRRRFSMPGPKKNYYNSLMGSFRELQDRLAGAQPSSPILAAGPLEQPAQSVTAEGILLAGDAAGYLDAITGEGLSLAFASALALEELVVPLFLENGAKGKIISKRDLRKYADEHKRILRAYLNVTQLVLFLARHPTFLKSAVTILDRKPNFFQHFLNANMGLAPLFPGFFQMIRMLMSNNSSAGYYQRSS
jgi:menaquinone-9 beta-reductase